MSTTDNSWADGHCAVCGDPTARGSRTESGDLVCPIHEPDYADHDPLLGVSKVVRVGAQRANSPVLHLPDASNAGPLCGQTTQKRDSGYQKGWMVRELAAFPPAHRDWCSHCLDRVEGKVT